MKNKVSVVGQGYVGLPLAIEAAKHGFDVYGIDIKNSIVNQLNLGKSHIEDVTDLDLSLALKNGKYLATNDFNEVKDSEIVIICVPTPLNEQRLPDLSALESAVISISKNMSKNTLIIVESTIEPGTTKNLIIPLVLKHSGFLPYEVYFAYSPERIDPRNQTWSLKNTPKLISGGDEIAIKRAFDFYSKFIKPLHIVDSIEVAETSKLLENTFRFINISLINEISHFCYELGIDVNDVIAAASTKPYGFMAFYPSIGIGGHCIPVDPLYLLKKSNEIGAPISMIDLADKVNLAIPSNVVKRAERKLGVLKGKKVLVIGVSYKPNVSDVRETPAKSLIQALKAKGAEVSWHDDLVGEWEGTSSSNLDNLYDLAIIATPHDYLDLSRIKNTPMINTRGSI
jgi:UDP-N-acetyl-D-glucosamine dehydrogenase